MIVINIGGGPGSGKTTLAYYLTYRLKIAGYRAEFVGEAARESHIYPGAPGVVPPALQDNQVLLTGQQYERVKRLERHGVQVAVTDSPIIQGILYETDEQKRYALEPIVELMQQEFSGLNLFMHRKPGTFDAESRVQRNEAEAAAFDERAHGLMRWDYSCQWGDEDHIAEWVLMRLRWMSVYPMPRVQARDIQSSRAPEHRSFASESDSE